MIEDISRDGEQVYISIINLAEVWYILERRAPGLADDKVGNLRSFGIEVVPLEDDSIWRMAAKIKSNRAIPLADAIAVATAKYLDEPLLVGDDHHFRNLGIDIMVSPAKSGEVGH